MKASEVINKAKAELFERGWAQGAMENENGEVCIRGAITCAIFGDIANWYLGLNQNAHYGFTEINKAQKFVDDCIVDKDAWGVVFETTEWNDEPSRQFNEVIDIMDLAEKKALIAEELDA